MQKLSAHSQTHRLFDIRKNIELRRFSREFPVVRLVVGLMRFVDRVREIESHCNLLSGKYWYDF